MRSLANNKHLVKSWLAFTRSSITREMEFRGNFLVGLFRQLLWMGAFVLTIEVVFANTKSLAGWNKPEVILILGLSRLTEGGMDTLFAKNIARFPEAVQKGEFDYFLTKPLPVLFYTTFRRVNLDNIGNMIAGIILIFLAINNFPHLPSISQTAIFAIIALCGITTYYALLVTVSTLAFRLERLNAMYGFIHLFTEPLTTPLDIFPFIPRIALTYIIPIAFIVFIPAQALTGRLNLWHLPLAILIAGLFLTLANLAWKAGLKRYTSASS